MEDGFGGDPTEYKSVWISLVEDFCNEKYFHNLLWIYTPDESAPNSSMYYRGNDYVHIVAIDVYNSMKGYHEIIQINKPFALGELGPHTTDGQFDYRLW